MARQRSSGSRIGAFLRGDVSADELLDRLRACGGVYDDVLAADRLRDELRLAGIGPAQTSPAESSQLLCTWLAYASVSLARAFIEAGEIDATRSGFLPRASAEQAHALLRDVPAWSGRARRAAHEPGYDVAAEVRLPASLPWVVSEPGSHAQVDAMRRAGAVMLDHIEAALGSAEGLTRSATPELVRLRGMAIDAQSRLEYSARLPSPTSRRGGHVEIEDSLRDGVTACWALGQMLARPRLVTAWHPGRGERVSPSPPGDLYGGGPPWRPRPGSHDSPYGHHHHH